MVWTNPLEKLGIKYIPDSGRLFKETEKLRKQAEIFTSLKPLVERRINAIIDAINGKEIDTKKCTHIFDKKDIECLTTIHRVTELINKINEDKPIDIVDLTAVRRFIEAKLLKKICYKFLLKEGYVYKLNSKIDKQYSFTAKGEKTFCELNAAHNLNQEDSYLLNLLTDVSTWGKLKWRIHQP